MMLGDREAAFRYYLTLVNKHPKVRAARTPDGRAGALIDVITDDLTRTVAPAAARAVADVVRRFGEKLASGVVERGASFLMDVLRSPRKR